MLSAFMAIVFEHQDFPIYIKFVRLEGRYTASAQRPGTRKTLACTQLAQHLPHTLPSPFSAGWQKRMRKTGGGVGPLTDRAIQPIHVSQKRPGPHTMDRVFKGTKRGGKDHISVEVL
uniref:Uncharacterized protein n=1 Tax=Schistocephalus solidus TaxID=70667 RepID=A0A0X3PR96_SCHSO